MGMTLLRWTAGVVVACAVIGAAFLPFPANAPPSWATTTPAPLAAEIATLADVAGRTDRAVRAYRAARGLERWSADRADADTSGIRIDGGVPATVARAARQVAAEQWSALGSIASAAHAQIFVYVDSTTIPRALDAAGVRRPLEPGLISVAFALPEATDGTHCVTLVRLRGVSPAHIDALRRQSIVGVCGFFAAFGMPGDGIRRWLASTGYRAARRSDWHVPRAPAIDATALYALGDAGGRCLTSQAGACVEALQLGGSSARTTPVALHPLDWVIDGLLPMTASALGAPNGSLGDAESELLASAVRELGAERFARFWRSASSPESAFLAASGTSLESWTHAWVTRTYGAVSTRPTIRVRDVVWLALAAPLLLIAARRRDRVLSERLLPARA